MAQIYVHASEGKTFKHNAEELSVNEDNGMLTITNEGKHVACYKDFEWRSYHIPENEKPEVASAANIARAGAM